MDGDLEAIEAMSAIEIIGNDAYNAAFHMVDGDEDDAEDDPHSEAAVMKQYGQLIAKCR